MLYKSMVLATFLLIFQITLPIHAAIPVNSENLTAGQKQTFDFNVSCKRQYPFTLKIFGRTLEYGWAKDYFVACATHYGADHAVPCTDLGIRAIQNNQGSVAYESMDGNPKKFVFVFNCDCNIPLFCPS